MTTLTAEANISRRKLMASNKHGPPGKPPTTWPGAGVRPQPRVLIKNKAPVLVYQNEPLPLWRIQAPLRRLSTRSRVENGRNEPGQHEPLLGFVPPKKLRRKKNDTKPVPQPVLTDWNGIGMGMACIFITLTGLSTLSGWKSTTCQCAKLLTASVNGIAGFLTLTPKSRGRCCQVGRVRPVSVWNT